MKIYFTSSPRGKEKLGENFKKIYDNITELGYEHSHDFLFQNEKHFLSSDDKDFAKHYKKSIADLKKADIAVFEVSTSSLGIGFLINKALEFSKPTIVLHITAKQPVLLEGIDDERLQIVEYDPDILKETLTDALEIAKEGMDTRFNFFVSPKIISYLDWISKNKKIPRAVYLRNLLEKEMEKEKAFKTE